MKCPFITVTDIHGSLVVINVNQVIGFLRNDEEQTMISLVDDNRVHTHEDIQSLYTQILDIYGGE